VSAHQSGREVKIDFGATRVVLIALNALPGTDGLQQVQDFGWPVWNPPTPPGPNHQWKAVFSAQARAFEGLYCSTPQGQPPQVVKVGEHLVSVTDAMWQMLHASQSVVLCAGLTGDPTAGELSAAASQGMLRAVLVQALLE
jgi:hypothetical protein